MGVSSAGVSSTGVSSVGVSSTGVSSVGVSSVGVSSTGVTSSGRTGHTGFVGSSVFAGRSRRACMYTFHSSGTGVSVEYALRVTHTFCETFIASSQAFWGLGIDEFLEFRRTLPLGVFHSLGKIYGFPVFFHLIPPIFDSEHPV